MELIEMTAENMFELISAHEFLIVDIHADWCPSCVRMLKILPNLANDLAGRATIVKANIDRLKMLKEIYEVKSIPTFLFFRDGEIVHRFDGIKTLAEIKGIVDRFIPTVITTKEEVYAEEESSSTVKAQS